MIALNRLRGLKAAKKPATPVAAKQESRPVATVKAGMVYLKTTVIKTGDVSKSLNHELGFLEKWVNRQIENGSESILKYEIVAAV